MDRVLTIHDWWDGPLLGLATLAGETVIYQRLFSEEEDCYTAFYDLTPIDRDTTALLLRDWEDWCRHWRERSTARLTAPQNTLDLEELSKTLPKFRQYRKRAVFTGHIENFHTSPENYFVYWSD